MVRFFKIFTTLLIISLLAIGIYYYFNNNTNSDNVEDKTNIENTVKSAEIGRASCRERV